MISIIVAQANNRVIGRSNDLPWYLPADLRHFRQLTTGHPVIMGRKTHESVQARLGKPLPDRENIVVSRGEVSAPGCTVVPSLEAALGLHPEQEMFVMGGASIYEQALPQADRIYLTQVDAQVEGDTFFPPIDMTQWRETAREAHAADEKNPYPYIFLTLERR